MPLVLGDHYSGSELIEGCAVYKSQLESRKPQRINTVRDILTATIVVKPREVSATIHLQPLQKRLVASVYQLVFHQNGRKVAGVAVFGEVPGAHLITRGSSC